VGALLAALVLALLPLPPGTTPALAATGGEDSAVTVAGKKGTYDDFSRLKVTVHQTKQLRSQGVRISWTGGAPTPEGNFKTDFLQVMQCWGDDPSGPRREQCEFGNSGSGAVPGAYTTARGISTSATSESGDPDETEYKGDDTFVPFQPVGGLPPTTSPRDPTYFGPLDTNEQVAGRTFGNGTGEVNFEVQDGVQAPHLGCGMNTAPSGSAVVPRSCWLVIVPRGTHDANGTDVVNPAGPRNERNLTTSPLSATNWAQRMVVRLDFLSVDTYCPEGQPERPTAGSELVTDVVTSWQPKLCQATGSTFAFTQGGEEEARNQVLGASPDSPLLGFTVDPVPRPEGGARVVHAPVAVSGVAVAFFIESPSGVVQNMRLTPRLVAKMLTHSYTMDVTLGSTPPDHLAGNPANFTQDPEFKKLNPDFPVRQGSPSSLMVPLQSSDTTRLVWNWLQSDKDAREFLSGTPDEWGTRVNRYFRDLKLATATSLADFPKVDPTTSPAIADGTPPLTYTVTDLDPYTADMHDGAVRTLRGNNNSTIKWEAGVNGAPPKLVNDPQILGQRAVLALVDAASAARYNLKTAALRNADGHFVKPTTDTLTAQVAALRPAPGEPSVLQPDPARARGRAYPLTAVAYAAASEQQDAAARKAYAEFIRYAATSGQTPGASAGQLPPGYAPLPAKQRRQAEAAADALERGQSADTPGSPGGSDTGGGSGGGGAPGTGAGTGGTASGGGAAGATSAGGTGGSSAPPSAAAGGGSAPPSAKPQQNVAEARAGFTPGDILGVIRWVLLAVLFLGGASGLSGPIMLHLAQRRTRRTP
jgi:ABC-type phosphate transport system substrate-binding protein